jgi:hypothetical protein
MGNENKYGTIIFQGFVAPSMPLDVALMGL